MANNPSSLQLTMEESTPNDAGKDEIVTNDIDEINEDQRKRLEFLLKQTEIFGHFVTNGTKPKSNIIEKSKKKRRSTRSKDDQQQAFTNDGNNNNNNNNNEAEKFECTPNYIKGEMRDYQINGLNWLILLYENGINGILADEMGLGKTLQSISMLGYLKHIKKCNGHFLVVVPNSTLLNWLNECNRWCPTLKAVLLIGPKLERKKYLKEVLKPGKWDVFITTYEMVTLETTSLKKFKWDYVIVDEAQHIKNEKTVISKTMRQFKSAHRLLLTGTPLQNNLHELWALLNYLLPDVFNSSDDFDEWFNTDTCLGDESLVNRLHAVLKPFVLRRIKSEVESSLLPKKEVKIYVGLSKIQSEVYKKILLKELTSVNSAGETKKCNLSYMLQHLRKCSSHPYLFNGVEPGPPYKTDMNLVNNSGKLSVLDKLLPRLKQQGSRVLIFVQFIAMMDILEDYCEWRGYSFVRFSGINQYEERATAVNQFNAPDSKLFIFLLSTRAGGLGINLATADVVIFYDSDWNPQVDLQATDRAHRIGQKKQVRVFRLITEHTIDELIDVRAERKLHLDKCVIQKGFNKGMEKDDILSILRFNTNQIFLSKDTELTNDDIDTILKRGEAKTAELVEKCIKGTNIDNHLSLYDFDGDNYRLGGKQASDDAPVNQPKKIYDFQFYPLELYSLMQMEKLSKRQQERKEKLLRKGFGNWTHADFEQFVAANIKYGRYDSENIIRSVDGKTPWEVLQYKNEFWERYHEINGIDDKLKEIIKVESGQTQRDVTNAFIVNDRQTEEKLRIQNLLQNKIDACQNNPLQFLKIHYENDENESNNSTGFSIEIDRFLICTICQIGYDKTDVYELLTSKILKTRTFRPNSFIKLCTTSELKKRCEMLIKLIENEESDDFCEPPSKRPKLSLNDKSPKIFHEGIIELD